MENKTYKIIIFNGLTGKHLKKYIMDNTTYENAANNAYKERITYTLKTGTYCDCIIKELKEG